ncbi:hypothetical protein BpHYR1_012881 [Brachionus plicatilis]|uniref:Uncharacterized protein n=1 Tax=Brachionus plicatilis TaxID=10195 RepID=A0A3M7QG28_BRAPC|nr:hypothetical protein BpHYR1_012881 [Brachionus plicatilis]
MTKNLEGLYTLGGFFKIRLFSISKRIILKNKNFLGFFFNIFYTNFLSYCSFQVNVTRIKIISRIFSIYQNDYFSNCLNLFQVNGFSRGSLNMKPTGGQPKHVAAQVL